MFPSPTEQPAATNTVASLELNFTELPLVDGVPLIMNFLFYLYLFGYK